MMSPINCILKDRNFTKKLRKNISGHNELYVQEVGYTADGNTIKGSLQGEAA